jgi:peptide/nickel transport system ATP-binding protein
MNAPTQPEQTVLDIRNLHVEYMTDRGPVRAVENVSFNIQPGEVFGLAGESGCGKSTIAHTILRVLRPPAVITGGQILYKGVDVLKMDDMSLEEYRTKILATPDRKEIAPSADIIETFRWAEVSMVFQSAMNSLNPVIKVVDQLTDVLMKHEKLNSRQARERAGELMDIVNIDKRRLDAYPHELSGGMRQRVVIAIALALKPSLMVMDEPTTALDVVVQKDILQQIEQLKKDLGFSILFITHDLSLMVEFSDRIGIMYAGEIVELAPAKEILTRPLHPYTQGLLSSFPSITGPKAKLMGIPGAPPNLLAPPKGCRFHPRCQYWDGVETDASPALEEVSPGHWVACTCNKKVILEKLAG